VFRMENDLATLLKIGITRSQQQFARDCQRCCPSYPIPLLHI
jgi:hypothetical protein